MQILFSESNAGPERLLCEAEIVFDDPGPLAGLKLVGFNLWRGTNGTAYVTFPARAFAAGTERRFFDYLRPTDAQDTRGVVLRLKASILAEYEARSRAASD